MAPLQREAKPIQSLKSVRRYVLFGPDNLGMGMAAEINRNRFNGS